MSDLALDRKSDWKDMPSSDQRGCMPTFLIVGAAKSGTTSLAAYLAQHPDVFIPTKKEPNYFALKDCRTPPVGPAPPEVLTHLLYNLSAFDRDQYIELFSGQAERRARGEASVRYFYFDRAAKNIHSEIPDVRIVVILREPIARAFSHFNMNRQYQLEPLDFLSALEAESQRIAAGWGWDWHYAAVSRYVPQLERYFKYFGRDAVAVFLQEDLLKNPLETFKAVCRHIGVSENFAPDFSEQLKVSYLPKNLWLDKVIHWPHPTKEALVRAGLERPMLAVLSRAKKLNLRSAPKLDSITCQSLDRYFKNEVAELEELLGRKLNWSGQK